MEKETYSVEDIYNATCGVDDYHEPKSVTTLNLTYYKNKQQTKTTSRVTSNAVVNILKRDCFVQIDLLFRSETDKNLTQLWDVFEEYGKSIDALETDKVEEFPVLCLVLIPKSLDSKCYITGMHPIFWVLQKERPGSQSVAIRILFNESDINFLSPDFDYEQLDKEIEADELKKKQLNEVGLSKIERQRLKNQRDIDALDIR